MRIHGFVDNDVHPPRFGSTQRSFGIFRGLARRHEVDVMCIVPYRNRAAREATASGVRIHRRRAWYTAAAWRLEQLGIAPLFLAAHGHASRAQRLLDELEGDADVHCVGSLFAGMLSRSRAPLKTYLSQNVEFDHYRMTAPARLRNAHWANRMRALEAETVSRSDVVVVCSDEDAERMRELYGIPAEQVLVAPNGYDETAIRPAAVEERRRARRALGIGDDEYAAIFLGSDAPPNREALAWLLRELLPRLEGEGFKLLVVGGVSRFADSASRSLVATPPVDDVSPWLHAADVGVNPVGVGGGSNVKVPTYLAAGLAVVTTPYGLRGYARLAPSVDAVELSDFVDACAARPRGWKARGDRTPAPLEAFAWGSIGESLGEALEARRGVKNPPQRITA